MSDNVKQLPIYFNDLNDEAKERFLEFNGCKKPSDGNWDINTNPITIFEVQKPTIQIYSVLDMDDIDSMEFSKHLGYLAHIDFELIDLHHPVYQIKICEKEMFNPNFRVFTLSPFVIQWAIDNCVPVRELESGMTWSDENYIEFFESFKSIHISLSLSR